VEPDTGRPAALKARPRYTLARGLLLGLAIALAITAVVTIARHRGSPKRLTEEAYEAALTRWDKDGPSDYDLDLELLANRPSLIQVEVGGGEIVHMTRDGIEPSQKRTWDVWSVPGQFETIGQELEMAKRPAESFGTRGAAEVVIWAEFDPTYGYPRRYDRVV